MIQIFPHNKYICAAYSVRKFVKTWNLLFFFILFFFSFLGFKGILFTLWHCRGFGIGKTKLSFQDLLKTNFFFLNVSSGVFSQADCHCRDQFTRLFRFSSVVRLQRATSGGRVRPKLLWRQMEALIIWYVDLNTGLIECLAVVQIPELFNFSFFLFCFHNLKAVYGSLIHYVPHTGGTCCGFTGITVQKYWRLFTAVPTESSSTHNQQVLIFSINMKQGRITYLFDDLQLPVFLRFFGL